MNTFALFMLSVALSIPLLSIVDSLALFSRLITVIAGADNCSFVTFSEDDITMKSQTTYELTVTARQVLNTICSYMFCNTFILLQKRSVLQQRLEILGATSRCGGCCPEIYNS